MTTPPPRLLKIWKTLALAALLAVTLGGALLYTAPLQAQSQSTSGVTPSVTIYLSSEAFSGAGEEVEATFTFNTVVTGFDLSDISVSGGSKSASALTPSQGGAVYTGTFTTAGDAGDMTLTVAANSASNANGATGPTAEVSATAQRDTHAQEVESFTSGVGSFVSKDASFRNTIVLSEKVSDFGPEDLVITNGVMTGFVEDIRGLKFYFGVRVNGQGDMLATLKANSVRDADGMWWPPSPVTLRVPMNVPEPKVVITGVPAFIKDTTPFTASFAFSQRVTNFTVQDIRATNAALGQFTEVETGKEWTVEVTPDGMGDVNLAIPKSSVMGQRDHRGPKYATTAGAVWDSASPEVESITFVPVGIVNKWDRIKIIVTFDEPMRGFGMEDIAVTGAIKHPALQEEADGALYTGLLNHTGGDDGVTVTVAAFSATDRAGNAGPVDPFSATAAAMNVLVTDYDADDDYLIEIRTLAQLDALRYDRDGDGDVLGDDHKAYDQAFPNGGTNMGCPGPCRGYELTTDLDFDTNGSGAADAGDAYWNGGKGWKPIAKDRDWKSRYMWDIDREQAYNAIFEGNDHTISNLYMKEGYQKQAGLGLFRTLGADAEVRNLRLENVDITGGQYIGALSGSSEGYIHHVSSSGRVAAHFVRVGGLVGSLRPGGLLAHSHSSAAIHGGRNFTGGLVGNLFKGSVQYSYATGDVRGVYAVGGLVGVIETTVPGDTCELAPPAAPPVYPGAGEPGSVVGSYATGQVSAAAAGGGLVGINFYANITNSYATGDVVGRDFDPYGGGNVDMHGNGGLVGENAGSIANSYATGRLIPKPGGPSGPGVSHGYPDAVYGGLVGIKVDESHGWEPFRTVTFVDGSPAQRIDTFYGTAIGSYWDTQTSGFTASMAGVGMTTAEMQSPTSAAGIYAGWDTSVWDFGTSGEYPTLRVSGKTAALLPEAEPNTGCPALPEPGISAPKNPTICPVPRGCWFRSVPENSPEGTLVGAPVTDRGTGTPSYRMSGADAGKFTIDPATGQIKVGPNPDLDYEDDAKNSFQVAVAIARPGSSYSSVTVISVTDVNEAPAFAEDRAALSVVENTGAGKAIGAPVSATDPDGDALTYALGGADADHFAINSATGQLLTKGPLNSGAEVSYSATVTATDPDGLSASVPLTIRVTATPWNSLPCWKTGHCLLREVPENSPEGAHVGAPVFDYGTGTPTHELRGPDADKFTIDPATGQIKVGPNLDLDYEDGAKNAFTLAFTIRRPWSFSYTSLAIRVTDVNEAPAFAGDSVALSVAEYTRAGESIGAPVSATDPDGDALTYTLGSTDDDGHFAINAATGQLLTKGALDSRSDASYSVTVTATDPDGLSASVPVTITVTPVPVLFRRSVPENSPEGALVGDPVTAGLPAGATATYSLSGADADKFTIDSATGQIAVGANPDLDYEDDAKNAFAVKVTAGVSDGTSLRYGVAISVSDVNEAPAFAGDSVALSVAENTDAGTAIGAPVSATDPDGDALTYTLGSTDDDGHFAINAATGQLLTKGPLDSRSEDSYSVTVTATDPDGLSASVPVTITVTVDPALLRRSVPENSPEGTIVGAPVTAATLPAGATATYSLSGAGAGKFTIDSATGQIAVGANPDLDYEDDAKNSFLVKVRVTTNVGIASSYSLRISVTDVNEGPAFGQETVTLTIAENQPLGTIVGALPAATDPDGDALMYELRGKADSYDYLTFDVDTSTGSLRLKTEAPIDYESSGSDRAYNFELIVKDPDLLEDSIKVIVNVTDVNESPEFSAASVALRVAENTASGTDIGNPVAARDVDGDTLTYTLGTTGDDGHFAIDSATGQLSAKGALNYESDTSYSVTVTATDPDGLSDSVPVTITVTDAADAPAAFAAGMASRSVPENSPAGTKVGLPVTTTDEDGDTLTYSISGADAGSFAIDSATGQITVKAGAALDHETKNTHVVRVTASDGSLTSYVDVTISVTDVFVDHDQDDDGLIEVDSLQQLNAIRWDLNGDGTPDKRDAVDDYERVFPEGSPDMGCPSACLGYELTADLTFDTNGNGKDDRGDDYWNGGKGWLPIGSNTDDAFTAVFDGGGHTISKLLIERARSNIGLFGVISRGSVIRNVGLEEVNVLTVLTKPNVKVNGVYPPVSVFGSWMGRGALVGLISMDGRVERSYSTGFVKGVMAVGGLVGYMMGGTIENSYTMTDVAGNHYVGGIVGLTRDGDGGKNAVVRRVYSTGIASVEDMIIGGELSEEGVAGGIVAYSQPPLEGSIGYSSSFTFHHTMFPKSAGSYKDESILKKPTSASGIYAEWDESVWDFGTSSQLPALKYDTDGDGTATAAEFGSQRPATPSRTSRAAIEPVSDLQVTLQDDGSALLTWHESSGIDGDASYRVRRRSETAGFEIVARMVVDSDGDGALEYRDAGGALGHEYSVRPFNSEGRQMSRWSEAVAAVPPNRPPAYADASIALSLAENTAAGTDIGNPITATDPDGDGLTYALGGADADHFAIDAASGQLQTKGALDYESDDSYTVTVTATDPDGLSASVAVTIAVTDGNEAPAYADASIALSLAENTDAGTNIGDPITATDPDGDALTYALGGADADHFAIDAATGQMLTSGALDYETTASYTVSVTATDPDGLSASVAVTITVTDVEEITRPENVKAEAQPDGSVLLTWSAFSAAGSDGFYKVRRRVDSEDGTYAIVAQRVENGGQDSAVEYWDGSENVTSGQTYLYSVRPFDASGAKVGKWSEAVRVAIPLPNQPPAFADASIALSVAENTASGTNIGDPIAATDPDGDALTYALGGADADHFAIDAASGQLSTQGALDYESDDSYAVTVTATDDDGLSASVAVTITVTDVADTPPGQPAPPTFTNIAETGFRILWTAPTPGSSPVDAVGLQYKPTSASDEAWADVKPAPGTGRRGFNLTNRGGQHVTAGASYDVRVRERNAQGWGEWSEAGTVTTAGTAQVQPARPEAPAFAEVQETRFRILWQAPAPGASPITGYGIQYKLSSASDEAWADVKPEPRGVRAAGFNLTNRRGQSIAPGTSYDVRVRAQNAQGWGEWSEAGTVTTAGTAPAGS